jgi:predicted Zn-dependent protease
MAVSFFKMKKYEEALAMLKEIDNAPLTTELARKINDSLQKNIQESTTPIIVEKQVTDKSDPVTALRTQIEELLSRSDYKGMLAVSKEALDSYPLQPYFYFAYGTALNNTGDTNKAIEVLESGLDYLLDDGQLESNLYRELSKAYNKIGNTQKANEYLNKINSGL